MKEKLSIAAKASLLLKEKEDIITKYNEISNLHKKNLDKISSDLKRLLRGKLIKSISSIVSQEKWFYNDYEQLKDVSCGDEYHFEVTMTRSFGIKNGPDDSYAANKKRDKRFDIDPGDIKNYDDLIYFISKYNFSRISYKDCFIDFNGYSFIICSKKSKTAVYNLINEWKVSVDFTEFVRDIENLESKLQDRKDLMNKIATQMLFTVGK